MTADPRATAWCHTCCRNRPIVKAHSQGTRTRYMYERRFRWIDLPPDTRQLQVWFDCGHDSLIVSNQLEMLEITIDKNGCAQPWSKER